MKLLANALRRHLQGAVVRIFPKPVAICGRYSLTSAEPAPITPQAPTRSATRKSRATHKLTAGL